MSFNAKFIETSVGIQHNVDELLVGILKQIRLRQAAFGGGGGGGNPLMGGGGNSSSGGGGGNFQSDANGSNNKKRNNSSVAAAVAKKAIISSPLHTLQVARDILAKVCLNASQSSNTSCENLHVL